jgi:malate dehydrogenase (oxaloacetate-decarboxylating)
MLTEEIQRREAAEQGKVTEQQISLSGYGLHLPTLKDKEGPLLPPISQARTLGRQIAEAVGMQALRDGQAQVSDETELEATLAAHVWEPAYVSYKLIPEQCCPK